MDEPTAWASAATAGCVPANDTLTGTFSKTENEIQNRPKITLKEP